MLSQVIAHRIRQPPWSIIASSYERLRWCERYFEQGNANMGIVGCVVGQYCTCPIPVIETEQSAEHFTLSSEFAGTAQSF